MNENTISYKLDRIKNSTDRMRAKTGVVTGAIEDVATAVEDMSVINNQDKEITENGSYSAEEGYTGLGTVNVNVEPLLGNKTITVNGTYNAVNDNLQGYATVNINVPTGGGTPVKSNIYRVSTIEERNAITDMVEGDICVVYESIIDNATVDSRFKMAIFPEVVVLDTAITDFVDVSYRAVDESIRFDCWGMLDSSTFDMSGHSESGEISIQYTSTDGITYTRTDTTGNPVDFGTEIHYRMPEYWNDAIGKFIQATSINFSGVFQYKDNNWNYININIPTTADYIYKDCKAYTNNGIIVGTLASNPSTTLDDMNARIYSELAMLYNNLDEIIAPEDSSSLYAKSNMYIIPSKINGKSLLNTSNVTKMYYMFSNCHNLISIPKLDTNKVTDMSWMFNDCPLLTSIPQLDTSNVTNMRGMFNSCSSLTEIPQLDTGKVINMNTMFNNCKSLISISQLDTSNVTDMNTMFQRCESLTEIPQLNTSNVTDMSLMFNYCKSLISIPQLDTSNVTSMRATFEGCESLTEIPQLNTSKVTHIGWMFHSCKSLTTIPLLDAGNANDLSYMFEGCTSLTTLGGFKDLGKAYSTAESANYSKYRLILSESKQISHDSLMNIINNLYNIASKGCKTQRLYLGSTNLAKLTDEEIAIATNKGWTVS